MIAEGALIISNVGLGDETFCSDVGSWNVTRAKHRCLNGNVPIHKFPVPYVAECGQNIEVEEEKIVSMMADIPRLVMSPPVIFFQEWGAIWLIDGHHRINALSRLKIPNVLAFVIEEGTADECKVYYNGERVAPWMRPSNTKKQP